MIDDNLDKVEQQTKLLENYYDSGVARELSQLIADVNKQLRSGNFKDRTGALRRSMRAKLTGNNISISMKDYGYYLSFGVQGTGNKEALGLPADVAGAFGVKTGYKFGSDKVFGIKPRKFYPLDLEEKLLEILLNE